MIESETYDGRIERHLLDVINYTWGAAEMSTEVRSPKEVFSSVSLKRVKAQIKTSDEQQFPADDEPGGGTPTTPPDPGGGTVGVESKSFGATSGKAWGGNGTSLHSTSPHGFAPYDWYRIIDGVAALAWLGLR